MAVRPRPSVAHRPQGFTSLIKVAFLEQPSALLSVSIMPAWPLKRLRWHRHYEYQLRISRPSATSHQSTAILFAFSAFLRLSQAHTGPTAVLVQELDARLREHTLDHSQ